jgi:tetratricopeptide (TPR) repeat protein
MADSISSPQARRSKRSVLAIVASTALLGVGLAFWWQSRAPEPPEIPLEGLDPEVADIITDTRGEVLAEPRSAEAWGKLGRVLLANEVYSEIALACFQQAEWLDPENPRWPYFRARLMKAGQDEVLAEVERALGLCEPGALEQIAPRLFLAETFLAQGKSEAAEQHLRRVLDVEPDSARAQYDLGMVMVARSDWQAGRRHFEACLGNAQARGKAAAQLAMVCLRLGDKNAADKYAELAARSPRDAVWTDPFLAGDGQYDRRKRDRYRQAEEREAEETPAGLIAAAKILTDLARDFPKDDLPHIMLARVLGKMGRFEQAEQEIRIALSRAPNKSQPHYLLSLILFGQAEKMDQRANKDPRQVQELLEQSVAAARQALQRTPDYGHAHMALGRALWQLGKRPEAIAAMRDAVQCRPEFADNHLFLGLALAEEGNLAEARPYLEQARLLAGPQDSRARVALAKYFSRSGP